MRYERKRVRTREERETGLVVGTFFTPTFLLGSEVLRLIDADPDFTAIDLAKWGALAAGLYTGLMVVSLIAERHGRVQ